ncbi:MAG: amidase [Pseudomonadota bacterium]|nr:amidase [Pseudomonadota bacterium]
MDLPEYAGYDALGLAELLASGQVSPKEAARTAVRAIETINPQVNAVVEIYKDRIEALDDRSLGSGPFRGVPLLIKDVFGHEAGRLIENCSRLCQGMQVEVNTNYARLIRAAGVNIIGRTNTPEYSMAGTAENVLYGNTSTPWKQGYSAGGSTGGGVAAVVSGMVPIAHGTDIAGSIRIPSSWCGGVGLKPSRGRISFGPAIDENGFGLATHFVQTKSVRDTAAMLDCLAIEQTGDPFPLPRSEKPYAYFLKSRPQKLKIGWSVDALFGVPTQPEVADAVKNTASLLADMGHHVSETGPRLADGVEILRRFDNIWFFGFDARAEGYGRKTGRKPGPDTLEPVTLRIYEYAKTITPAQFIASMAAVNAARRELAAFFDSFDIWLSPTTARVSEPHGLYNLGRTDVTMDNFAEEILAAPCQFTVPHNIMGTPAISLPLAMSASGLPIGVQLGARAACEHMLIQLAARLEEALPWARRVPPLHVSNV